MNNSVSFPEQRDNNLTRRAFLNNQVASAYAAGDPRFNVKQYDRPGLSRGAGALAQAGIDASKGFARGIADAYQADNQYALSQAGRNLEQSAADEAFAQQATALQQQQAYADRMARLSAQQQQLGLVQGLLGGLLG